MGASGSKTESEKERALSRFKEGILHLEFEPFLMRSDENSPEEKIIRLKKGNKFTEKFLNFLKKDKIFVEGEDSPGWIADVDANTFFKREPKPGETGFYEDRLKFGSLCKVLQIYGYLSYKFDQKSLTVSVDLRMEDLFYFEYLECTEEVCTTEQFEEEVTTYIEQSYSAVGSKEVFGVDPRWTGGDISIIEPGEMDKYYYSLGLKTKKISFSFAE